MATAILPSKFERGDLTTWLREYDACAEANGWTAEAKIKKFQLSFEAKQLATSTHLRRAVASRMPMLQKY